VSGTVPPGLAKRGIVAVSHNLQPGEVVGCAKAFNRIFRVEIEARMFKKEPKGCDAAAAGVNAPCRSE
jgi:hypothetical protein